MTRLEKESLEWDINFFKQQLTNTEFEIEKLRSKRIIWQKLMSKALKKLNK